MIDPTSLHGSDTGVFVGVGGQEYGPRIYEETRGICRLSDDRYHDQRRVGSGRLHTWPAGPGVDGRHLAARHLWLPCISPCDRCGRVNANWRWRAVQPWCAHPASTSASAGRARCPKTADASRSLRRRTGSASPRAPACWCWPDCRARAALGYPVLALVRGTARRTGRSLQCAVRPQRSSAAAGDSASSGGRRTDRGGHRRGRGAWHRHEGRRSDRSRSAAGDIRQGALGGAATARRLGQVEHRAYAVRGRRRRNDQDRTVDSERGRAGDIASGFADTRRSIGRPEQSRWSYAHVRGPTDRPTPACWGVGVRHQRNECPRDTGAGTAGARDREAGSSRPPVVPWVLSAKSLSALAEQAARLQRFVEQHADSDPNDVAYSLVTTRASFDHRAVVVGAERDELLSGLAAIASGAPAPMW